MRLECLGVGDEVFRGELGRFWLMVN
jgi:hypothetical protein